MHAASTTQAKPNGAAQPDTKLAPVSRMSLANLIRGPVAQPITVVAYGPEGVGKSTFAADAPNPVFLCSEKGTHEMDVTRFPEPLNLKDFYDALTFLRRQEHDFQTLVLDTLDWLEPIVHAVVCQRFKVRSIGEVDHGKGYSETVNEFRRILKAFEDLREARGMNIVILGHAHVVEFKNPESDDYQRYELSVHRKVAALVKQWADAVLFMNYETTLKKNKTTKQVKAEATGARVMHTDRRAAFDAKNRYNLPAVLPLQWEAFEAGVRRARPEPAEKVLSRIEELCVQLDGFAEGEDTAKRIREAIDRAQGDGRRLRQLENWAKAQIQKLEEEATDAEDDSTLGGEDAA